MRICYTLLFFLAQICAHAQPEGLEHQSYAVQYRFVDSFLKDLVLRTPEGQKKVNELRNWARSHHAQDMEDDIVLWEFVRMNDDQLTDEKVRQVTDLAADAHDQRRFYVEANALQGLGAYWMRKRKYNKGFEHYLIAHDIYSRFPDDEFPPKQDHLYGLGGAYFHYEDFENAIKYMREALGVRTRDRDLLNPIINTLGLCFRKTGIYDSAEFYFRRIYDDAIKRNDTVWVAISGGNIGSTYFLQKRYSEAVPMLEKDVELSLATGVIRNAGGTLNVLAQIAYIEKDYDKSIRLSKQALTLMEPKSFWPDYPVAEQIFTQLSKAYAAKKDMANAYLYADSAILAKDSVASQNNAVAFIKAKDKVEFEHHKLEVEQLANQKKMQELVRNGLIIAIVLLTVIAILFINRQRLKQKKLEAEKKNTEHELKEAVMQLDGFRHSVQEKNSLIEQFQAELERAKLAPDEQTDEEVLSELERSIILTDEQWENFRQLFEKVHRNFFVNLKKKIPDLTQAEVRFLALTKLKLSSKEMASMLGISTNAIRIYRHRLRRKLNLDKEDMIEELVNNI